MTATWIIATYVIVWWLVFFAVLPVGGRSPEEAGNVTLGTDHGAPANPMLLWKVTVTTVLAAILFGFGYAVFQILDIGLDDLII
jgi:predicted secreted protein